MPCAPPVLRYGLYSLRGNNMPNWCHNKIIIKDKSKKIYDLYRKVCNHNRLNFNKIIPMPLDLQLTKAGSTSDIGYDAYYGNYKPLLEYSWIKSENITTKEQLCEFLDKSDPEYKKQGTIYKNNIDKYGYKNWYDWACANWGTKWNACYQTVLRKGRLLIIDFDTAWAAPIPILFALSKLTNSTVVLQFGGIEAVCEGEIHFKNGEIVKENIIDHDEEWYNKMFGNIENDTIAQN